MYLNTQSYLLKDSLNLNTEFIWEETHSLKKMKKLRPSELTYLRYRTDGELIIFRKKFAPLILKVRNVYVGF
jgi:hypothetical protein